VRFESGWKESERGREGERGERLSKSFGRCTGEEVD